MDVLAGNAAVPMRSVFDHALHPIDNLLGAWEKATLSITPEISAVTERIVERSNPSRTQIPATASMLLPEAGRKRSRLSCGNLALRNGRMQSLRQIGSVRRCGAEPRYYHILQ